MAKTIKAGTHTVREILDAAGFDFAVKAAADYLGGEPDHRRVKVGGLGFDSLEETLVVPYTADTLEVTLDGDKAVSLKVELDDEQEDFRKRSFETAADLN